jgi:hypothetical protein
MEAICSSEMSVDIQRTARRHIPEDDTLQVKIRSNVAESSKDGYGSERAVLPIVMMMIM